MLHETVEVHALLVGKWQRLEEHIHQIGLAPANPPPQVQPGLRLRLAQLAEQTATAPGSGQQAIIQILQGFDRPRLGHIVVEVRALEITLVLF